VDDDDIGVLNVTPVIRHRAPTECGRQTDDRGAVSDSGLLFYVHHAKRAHQLGGEIPFLTAEGGAARERDALAAIDGVALGVLVGEGYERAPDRAVRTQRVHFLRPVDPEVLLDLDRLGEVEAQGRGAQRARTDRAELDEIPSCDLGHGHVPPTMRERRWYRRSITEARTRTESSAWPSHQLRDARRQTMGARVEIKPAVSHEPDEGHVGGERHL